jgi:hypothetical protein
VESYRAGESRPEIPSPQPVKKQMQGTAGSRGGSRCTQEQGTETRAFVSGFYKSPSKGSLPVSHPEPGDHRLK